MEKICGIYKITSPTGGIYIGQSTDTESRKSYYRRLSCRSQLRLYNSIKKHGWDKHTFDVIHICLESELNKLEIYYIDLFKTFNTKHGLNLRDGGGSSGKYSNESRRKMSNTRRERKIPAWNKGKKRPKFSKEWRKNMSKAHTGLKPTKKQKINQRRGVLKWWKKRKDKNKK